jgi:hypothetical protein
MAALKMMADSHVAEHGRPPRANAFALRVADLH